MVQKVRVLATKFNTLNTIHRIHVVEKNRLLKVVL